MARHPHPIRDPEPTSLECSESLGNFSADPLVVSGIAKIPVPESFAKIPRSIARYHLSGQVFQVLIAIASHADKEGFAYPSLSLIVKETGINRKNIPRLIAKAKECGLLRREHRAQKSGAATKTGYIVFLKIIGRSSEDGRPSSDLSRGALKSEDGGVLKFEPRYKEQEQTNFNLQGTDQPARAKGAAVNGDRLLAGAVTTTLLAPTTNGEKARRKEIWRQKVINYAHDTMSPEEFRRWCTAYLENNGNSQHWSVRKANQLSAEMKERKSRENWLSTPTR